MCPDRSVLSEFFDNEITGKKRKRLTLHLEECAFCRKIIREFERQRRFLGSLGEFPAPPDTLERFWIYAGHACGRYRRAVHRTVPILISAAAVFFLILTSVFDLFQTVDKRNVSAETVVSQDFSSLNLDVTPGELDLILSYMEKQGGLTNDVEILLSGETPVTRYGAPEMVRSPVTKSSP